LHHSKSVDGVQHFFKRFDTSKQTLYNPGAGKRFNSPGGERSQYNSANITAVRL
jgi:hypothetical protein